MDKFEKVFETLEKTKTNWAVNKLPLVSTCGKSTGSFGLFRSDNDAWLGTTRDRYQVFNNANLVEHLIDACGSLDLEITNGGILDGGKKVFFQIALQDEYIGRSGIRRNITATNSHDGFSCIGFGSTNTVIVCQNTFYRAYNQLEKVRHSSLAEVRVAQLAESIKLTIDEDKNLMETFKRMADIQATDEMVAKIVSSLFKIEPKQTALNDVSTRRKNQINTFADCINTEYGLQGNTVWGLFNAVTRYTNHKAAPTAEDAKANYLMNGNGLRLSNLAFNELLAYVERNTREYVMVQ